jgi:hypothetical protein
MRPFQCVKHFETPREWLGMTFGALLTAAWAIFFAPEVAGVFATAFFMSSILIWKAKALFFRMYSVLVFFLCAIFLGLGAWNASPLFGFLALFSGMHGALILLWARRLYSEGYFPPDLHWSQGWPKTQPRISATWKSPSVEEIQLLGIHRLDHAGAVFVTFEQAWEVQHIKPKGSSVRLVFQNEEILVPVRPVVYSQSKRFLTVRWGDQSADLTKQLSDFVEKIRGFDYAEAR